MPGFFNTLGTYMAGASGLASKVAGSRTAGMIANAAMGKYGNTVRSAMMGGVAGAAYGAVSDDTSILGGMMAGAAMGAGAYRYGYKPAMAVERLGLGAGMSMGRHLMSNTRAMGKAMGNAMMRDARQIKLAANQGMGRIKGLGYGLGGGMV